MRHHLCINLVVALITLLVLAPLKAHAIAPAGNYTGTINFRRATPVGGGTCQSGAELQQSIFFALTNVAKTTGRKFDATYFFRPAPGKQITRVTQDGKSIKVDRFVSVIHSGAFQFKYFLTLRNVKPDKAVLVYRGVTTYEGTNTGCAYRYGGTVAHS